METTVKNQKKKLYIGTMEMDVDKLEIVPMVRVALMNPNDDQMVRLVDTVTVLDPRTDLVNHSPTGFQWGYAGSGPSQLALAILADLYTDGIAIAFHQSFKEKVMGSLMKTDKCWVLHEEDIRKICEGLEGWIK